MSADAGHRLSALVVSALLLLEVAVGAGVFLSASAGHARSNGPARVATRASPHSLGTGPDAPSGLPAANSERLVPPSVPVVSDRAPPALSPTNAISSIVPSAGHPGDLYCSEVGLPAGSYWGVQLSGLSTSAAGWCGGAGSAFNTSLPPEIYSFLVGNFTTGNLLYRPMPRAGYISTNGSDAQIDVTFTAVHLQAWTFNETGLPSGQWWVAWAENRATGQWTESDSTSATLAFYLLNGTYEFEVPNVTLTVNVYVVTPAVGNATLSGSGASVNVSFTLEPTYELTFTETGLPAGTWWTVGIVNVQSFEGYYFKNSTTPSIGFLAPTGQFEYVVDWLENRTSSTLFSPQSGPGLVTVQGGTASVTVPYRSIPGYSVTFSAEGLPHEVWWEVTVYNSTKGLEAEEISVNRSIDFLLPNGTWEFGVTPWVWGYNTSSVRYLATPTRGNVSTSSSVQTVQIDYTPYYEVEVNESGLPSNASWYVNVSGAPSLSANGSVGSISTYLPNGSYALAVSTNDRTYAPSYRETSLTVEGASPSLAAVKFTLQTYPVTFTESGLPPSPLSKHGWSVSLDGATIHSFTDSITFPAVPNATIPVLVTGPAGYRETSVVAVDVTGPATVPVTFSKGRTYAAAFAEEGLPAGRGWCVTFHGASECGSSTILRFQNLSSGSYVGLGASASSWSQPIWIALGSASPIPLAAAGPLVVPKELRVTVIFGQEFQVTFGETGLSYWYWLVSIDGSKWSAPWNGPLVFDLVNGTYGYTVGKEAGYRVSGGRTVVSGMPGAVIVHFSSKGKAQAVRPVPEIAGRRRVEG